MARRIRTAVTMLVLVGILCAGAWYGWTGLTRGADEVAPEEPPSPTCTTPKPDRATARRTTVSVLNAGAPVGTGGLVMDALTARGFREGVIEFAPRGVRTRGTVVWASDPDSAEAQLVARQLKRPEVRRRADLWGPGVNVLFGDAFTGLRKAPRSLTVRPEPVCE